MDADPTSRGVVAPFAPDAVNVGVRHVQLGPTEWVATLVVTGYPRDVHAGWLAPFTQLPRAGRRLPARHPDRPRHRGVAAASAAGPARVRATLRHRTRPATRPAHRRRHRGRLRPGRPGRPRRGPPVPGRAVADRARRLPHRTGRAGRRRPGAGRQHAHRRPPHPLPRPARLGHRPAARAGQTRPAPHLRHRRVGRRVPVRLPRAPCTSHRRSTDATDGTEGHRRRLGAAFGAAAAPAGGVLYGYNLGSRSLVFWDRFACDNYNSVILGRSGAGKSYLVKLELLRSLYRGVEAHVIDPEDEYTRLAHAVGGAVITPGAPGVHLNPFDLPITVRGGRRTAPPGRVDPPRAVPAHLPHRPARRAAHRDRPGRARHRHHRHLHRRRHHRRPRHLGPPGAAARRPARHPHRHRRPRRRTPAPAHDGTDRDRDDTAT